MPIDFVEEKSGIDFVPDEQQESPRTNRFGETRADLERQMREARAEGIGDKAILGLADLGERAAYTASLMDPLTAVGRVINPNQQSAIPVEAAKRAIEFFDPFGNAPVGSARAGAQEFGAELVSGFGQPEVAGAAMLGKVNPQLSGRLFQPGLIKGSQQAAANLAQAETPAEAAKAALELGLTVGGTAGIEAHGAQAAKLKPTDLVEPKAEVVEPVPEPKPVEPPAPVKVNLPEEIKVETKPEVAAEPTLPETKPEPTPAPAPVEAAPTPKSEIETGERIRADLPEAKPILDRIDEITKMADERHAQMHEGQVKDLTHPSQLLTHEEAAELHALKLKIRMKTPQEARADILKRRAARQQPTPTAEPAKAQGKQPWEMTQNQYHETLAKHFITLNKERLKNAKEHGTENPRYARNTLKDWQARLKSGEVDYPTRDQHRRSVEKALSEGKPVPAEVLKDYPELAPKPSTTTVPATVGGFIGEPIGEFAKKLGLPEDFYEFVQTGEGFERGQKTGYHQVSDKYRTPELDAALDRLSKAQKARIPTKPMQDRVNAEMAKIVESAKQPQPPAVTEAKPSGVGETQPTPEIKPIGMGGAVTEEFAKGQGSPTAMKYRLIDEERRKRGLEPLTTIGKRSDQAMMDRAMAEIDKNAEAPEILADQIIAKPRPIEDWENHMLLLRKIDLREEFHKAAREASQAYEDSVQFPERLADMHAANARASLYWDRLNKVEQASRYSGSMRGAALRSLQVMANEDYSLASLKAQARQNRDWEVLTPEKEAQENADLLKIADEHKAKAEELQKKLDELEKKQQNENLADIVVKLKGESARTPKGATTTVGTLTDKIRAKYEKNPKADIRFFVRKLARQFVAEGTKDRDVLVDQVHGVLSQIIPDLERRNTMDLISGYGDYSRLPKDTVSVILRDLSGQMQQIAKLEDMLGGDAPLRSGLERRTPSDAERLLQKQVEEQKKKGGYTVTDPETQLRTAQEAIQKRLENQIKDLELQIQTRQKIIKNPTKLQYDAKSNQLKARRDELKAVYNEIFAKPPKTEAERLAAWKERTKDRMDELKDFIAGTKQPKPKTTPVVLDKEALRIRFDLHTIERLWREKLAKEKRDQWTKWQKTRVIPGEVLNVSRALLTSFDFSAPGRQGAIIGLAHPVRASRALKPMFEAWRSEKGAFDAAEQIRNRENAPLYEIGKLYLAEHGGRLSKQEEAYMSRWASKIPGIRASERAYTTFLNRLRADSFDSMVNGLTAKGTASPAELQAIANFINVATGRGVGLEKSGTTLNTVFFAPRYVASRFQFLAGQPMYKGTAATRKMIAKEYAKFFAGAAVVYGLAQAAGATVGTDPRSSDFGKIIIGKTRIDPMAGLNQVSTLVGRTVTGENKPIKGKAYPIVGKVPYGKSNLLDIWANFFRSKLSPGLGTAVSLRYGKDVAGQPFDVTNLPATMAVPISWQDMFSAMREEGVPAGIALGLLSMFGAGVNTFENQVKR